MDRPWVAIQRNPTSGSGARRVQLLQLVAALRRHGLTPRLYSRREMLARRFEEPARREGLRCLVAAGGDGTVGDLINRYPGVPLAILPLGTENLIARYFGIPSCGESVAAMIAGGATRRVDLSAIGERRFAVMASLGFDADVVHRTHARRTGHITKFSYVQPICDSLRKYEYPRLRLYFDGDAAPREASLAVLVNLPVYALGLPVAASAAGDDGLLDVRLFQRSSALHMLRYFCHVALGAHERLPDVGVGRAATVRIESDVPVPIQVDGDPAGYTPAVCRVLPGALEVFVRSPRFD